ncbi:MAG: HD domain-containing protein [Patescibacteria group bacterium]
MTDQINRIKERAAEELKHCAAHDMDHVMRVYNLALTIAQEEPGVDLEVLEAATLLHDIGGLKEAEDPTGQTDHAAVGAAMARPIIEAVGFPAAKISHVQACILSHRYRTDNKPQTIEAKILFDADKLDAIGAIGIARGFAWVGKNNAKIYKRVDDLEAYARENLVGGKFDGRIKDRSKHSSQIQWELKNKRLVEKLYTASARKIGAARISFDQLYMDRLEREVKGEI